jgi:hypothetical protein
MLIIIGVAIGVVAFATMLRVRNPWASNPAPLGYMSERWLTEHRAAAMS